jgi:hypothetical protein
MPAAATLALASALSAALLIESKKKGSRGASAEIIVSVKLRAPGRDTQKLEVAVSS